MPQQCSHTPTVRNVAPRTPDGCEECLATGMRWVHLRLCQECGLELVLRGRAVHRAGGAAGRLTDSGGSPAIRLPWCIAVGLPAGASPSRTMSTAPPGSLVCPSATTVMRSGRRSCTSNRSARTSSSGSSSARTSRPTSGRATRAIRRRRPSDECGRSPGGIRDSRYRRVTSGYPPPVLARRRLSLPLAASHVHPSDPADRLVG